MITRSELSMITRSELLEHKLARPSRTLSPQEKAAQRKRQEQRAMRKLKELQEEERTKAEAQREAAARPNLGGIEDDWEEGVEEEEEFEADWEGEEEEFEDDWREKGGVGAGNGRRPRQSGGADAGTPSTHHTRGKSTMSTSKSNTSTSADNATTVIEPEKPGVVAALGDWTKRAAAAGVEGAKDGAAFAAAEVLTVTLISGLSIEFPFLLIAYRSSAVAQKIMQILVPYLIGAAATVGLLPESSKIISLCERALRAAISANVGPIMRRFEGPIMEAITQAGKTMGPRVSRADED